MTSHAAAAVLKSTTHQQEAVVQPRWIHQLLGRLYGIPAGTVLNANPHSDALPAGPQVAAELHGLALALQAAAYQADTGRVDYAALAGSPQLAEYRQYTGRLREFDPAALQTTAERMAFWINLYNALIIDGILTFGVRQSVQAIPGFFWRAAYTVGGRRYSAHDIEHGVLRANAPHPAIPGAHFARHDPRRAFALPASDPRVHFALVCGARACPPIRVYEAGRLDAQLDQAARSFVNGGGVRIMPQTKTVWLSKIFQWYAGDFGAAPLGLGSRQPLLAFITPYVHGAVSQAVLLQTPGWQVRFAPYDWRRNG